MPPILEQLREVGFAIQHTPRHAQYRLLRAKIWKMLEYPEMVASDAYKIITLCDIATEFGADAVSMRDTNEVNMCKKDGYELLIRSLLEMHCVADALGVCNEAAQYYPDSFESYTEEIYGAIRAQDLPNAPTASYIPRTYPTISSEYLTRSEADIESSNAQFKRPPLDGTCRISHSTLAAGKPDVYGVFATRPIPKQGLVHKESTTFIAATRSVPAPPVAHPPHDAASIPEAFDSNCFQVRADAHVPNALHTLLFTTFLSKCARDNCPHPLEHPLIAGLTASYGPASSRKFSLQRDIRDPIHFLEYLGIDTYGDLRYDMDVLLTVYERIRNNSFGCVDRQAVEGVGPLFSFFNHSCEPNVSWQVENPGEVVAGQPPTRSIVMRAKSNIEEGEELFITYIAPESPDGFLPVEERRKELMTWMGGPCQCTRCVRESEAEKGLSLKMKELAGRLLGGA
ncbi:uncharacterized protein BDZ99DRAFT_538899 [Mytilinidion resinicola]|uniref:SET domain-containing protein n=1 Tax=Mytilinidion resinicola TaxID=574789 RepID=A0A6A6YCJ7_9PEZI|nr:uncharacterized protein BDZ99DRAFT_538899 [Mytilinidion resinicola]KAF2806556.1 hypothetical protein BDZ99DRAFT_538899 [Mytilinidion resinicola]